MQPNPLRAAAFRRLDESPDSDFYREPRLVTHLDEAATAALTAHYQSVLPAGGHILDLMSSWVSHLPPDMAFGSIAGLGLNADELEHNSRLTSRAVHDLNATPSLPYVDAGFDAALIALSVQYLTRPLEVFAELARVLRPGARLHVAFSNRCFPSKAVAAWQSLDDYGRAELVKLYFRLSGGFAPPAVDILCMPGGQGDPLVVVGASALPAAQRTPPAPITQA